MNGRLSSVPNRNFSPSLGQSNLSFSPERSTKQKSKTPSAKSGNGMAGRGLPHLGSPQSGRLHKRIISMFSQRFTTTFTVSLPARFISILQFCCEPVGENLRSFRRKILANTMSHTPAYGLLLFCCYFELFGRFLRPNKRLSALVTELRFDLVGKFRWPEMVTFEEMNLRPPERDIPHYIYRYFDAHLRKRRLLKTPNRATILRRVKRSLDSFRRHPEDAESLKHLVDGLRGHRGHTK